MTMRLICVVVVCIVLDKTCADRRQPPHISDFSVLCQPQEGTICRVEDESDSAKMVLSCKAEGYPEPEYSWYQNGKEFNVNRDNVILIEKGTYQIKPIVSFYSGVYQCKASNMYGTSLSKKVEIQIATMHALQDKVTTTYTAKAGESLKLKCTSPPSVPAVKTFAWQKAMFIEDTEPTNVNIDNKRIQMDENGNLYFVFTEKSDDTGNHLYKCTATNNILDVTSGGSYSKIRITDPKTDYASPALMYATGNQEELVVLKGSELKMKCIFSGKPVPSVTWRKEGSSRSVPIREHGTTALIEHVDFSDEGVYICKGENKNSINEAKTAEHKIKVSVQSVPEMTKSLTNTKKSDGDNVTFTCQAGAVPPPSITWFNNGQELKEADLQDRMHLSDDGTQLALTGLCKTCPDGTSDLRVIQCEASNVHGSVLSDAYLNVFSRTNITIGPTLFSEVPENITDVFFDCVVSSDENMPAHVTWFKKYGRKERRIRPDKDPHFILLENNTLHIQNLSSLQEEELEKYVGTYVCEATNNISSDRKEVELRIIGVKPRVLYNKEPQFPWLIIIAAGSGFLLFIIVITIICCCCCRDSKVDYEVDKKERKDGNDPVQEIINAAFSVYNRPEGTLGKLSGSRASLGSTMTLDRCCSRENLADHWAQA